MAPPTKQTPRLIARLRDMAVAGNSATAIAEALGVGDGRADPDADDASLKGHGALPAEAAE